MQISGVELAFNAKAASAGGLRWFGSHSREGVPAEFRARRLRAGIKAGAFPLDKCKRVQIFSLTIRINSH